MKKLKQKIRDKIGDNRIAVIKKILRVLRVIKNIIGWLLVTVSVAAVIIFVVVKANGGTPSVFGYSIYRVSSGSMLPELEVGDVILNKDITDISEINVRDIVTFDGGSKYSYKKVTHRVLVKPYDDGKGNTVLVTKGDANSVDDGEIEVSNVKSKFVTKLSFLKDIYNFFFSQWGLILFIFLLILVFFDELMNIVKLTMARFEEDGEEDDEDELEEEAAKRKAARKKARKKSKSKKRKGKDERQPYYGKKRTVKKKSKKKARRKISKKSKRRNKR